MKTIQMFSMGVALVCVCGCAPELAHSQNGQEEDLWQQSIRRSYPDNRGPQVAPNAIVDHYSPKMAEVEAQIQSSAPAADEAVPVASETAPAAVEAPAAVAPAATPAAPAEVSAAPAPAVDPAAAPAEAPAAVAPATPAAPATAEAAAPAAPAGEQIYVVQGGDTLGGIARKYYGSARRYDIILKANSNVIKNPQGLRPGMKLVIPQL